MLVASLPAKIMLPFAASGIKNTIPVASQIGITNGAASFTDGFPPLTMTPLPAGGVPPFGQDMNGVLYQISAWDQWSNAGGQVIYDSAFSAAIGGYPKGAVLQSADLSGYWLNTVDSNATNPDTGGAGWVPFVFTGITSLTGGNATITMTAVQYCRKIIVVTGTLTSNINVVFPAGITGSWLFSNQTSGAYTVTAKIASGASVSVPQGYNESIWSDGTNIYGGNTASGVGVALLSGATFTGAISAPNGTTGTQVVNISQFAASLASPGWSKLPNGLIVQGGTSIIWAGVYTLTVSLPLAWPNGYLWGTVSDTAATGSGGIAAGISAATSPNQLTSITIQKNLAYSVAMNSSFVVYGW
jgi:hypothetical protein